VGERGAALVASRQVLARERTLPLIVQLADLFPEGGLRRGSTVSIAPGGPPGATSLALALLAGPSAAGSWASVVGMPDLGLVAAARAGLDLERLALVPGPGPAWPVVTAALMEGFDVVLLRPPGRASPSDARKLTARARERGAVLVVLGDWASPADMHLRVVAGDWRGLEDGPGYLAGRDVEVEAGGRGAASRPRRGHMTFGAPPVTSVTSLPRLPIKPGPTAPGLEAVVSRSHSSHPLHPSHPSRTRARL